MIGIGEGKELTKSEFEHIENVCKAMSLMGLVLILISSWM